MIRHVLAVAFAVMLALPARAETAIVAGGCFWCVEADFESVPGVGDVVSGFTGGTSDNPSYDDHAGHYEAVSIPFDPERISYDDLIALFLRSVDVTDASGQFCDRGPSYRTAIFVNDARQRAAAKAAVAQAAADLGQPVVTSILPATTFWPAESHHQDYAKGSKLVLTRAGPKTQANAYKFYRKSCGRDARVKALWGNDAAFAK
jgi:peptide-methionine (S)-S-oxide reductase